ncbi:glutathione synthase [Marinicella sp. W31]|uniref:glutathione synthase n=1 Tax=Marinicella sp. W31 TaxID=3023713 RepID=UPI0037575203
MTQIAIIMDPVGSIKPYKDSTFAMMLEAQRRQYRIHYITESDLFCQHNTPFAYAREITVRDNTTDWFSLQEVQRLSLTDCDVILMRKDPPFDMEYIMDTYTLDLAAAGGALVVNKPQALRDANEKFFTEFFPEVTPQSMISRNPEILRDAAMELTEAIVKPMDGMGGQSIFKTGKNDKNLNVILETVTANGSRTAMVQQYIPEIAQGDKRILLINGKPVPYALARIPSEEDFRGNLAKGGSGKGVPLSPRDYEICEYVGPRLREMGIVFAGLDVIGDYLTEINVTSPTCIRELDALYELNIASDLFDSIESLLP